MVSKIRTAVRMIKLIDNSPLYLMDYFGIAKNKEIVYRLRNGIKYKVRAGTTDRFIINEIWLHKSYTPKGFEIKERDVVLDVGGHIGVFSVFASKFAKRGRVYVFEPSSENFELLKQNIKINDISNITAMNKAVSDREGRREFFIAKGENKGSNSLYPSGNTSNKVVVETISFADFIVKERLGRINFLKMDCEGGEYDILFKSGSRALDKIEKISMEYHNIDRKRNGLRLKEFLEKEGFQVWIYPEARKGRIYAKRK